MERTSKITTKNSLITGLSLALSAVFSLAASAQDILPRPEQFFGGRIGLTAQDSVKDFPKAVTAPKGAPNVLLILTDDVGFGASSTFGGPIPTPTMDRLAKAGLRYTQFHTTALCSPTRAALLSGRNHHTNATGVIMEAGTGFPGYNTLVIYIQGNNGASAEGGPNGLLNEMTFFNAIPEDFKEVMRRMDELGGPNTFNHYPIGWAHAMDTPFQWTKQIASHFGGTRNGLVISWPERIKDKGGIGSQFHHVIDIYPTILEAVGLPSPSALNGVPQKPIEGVSMAYSFDDAKAPSRRRTQYFEMLGNRAIYSDGWVAATTPPSPPWASVVGDVKVLDYKWELYRVSDDFSQAQNLAAKEPVKLRELQDLFWVEAARYNVLPLDNSKLERLDTTNRPSLTRGRSIFGYYPGQVRIPEGAAPDMKNKSFQIVASVEVPKGGANGMLITQGGRFAGWGLYVLRGKPVFTYNLAGVERSVVVGKDKLTPGKHTVALDFKVEGPGLGKGGTATLTVDDKPAGEGKIARTLPFRMSLDETLDCGEDTGTPIREEYAVPFKFTGTIGKVVIKLGDSKLTAADQQEYDEIRGRGVAAE